MKFVYVKYAIYIFYKSIYDFHMAAAGNMRAYY